MKFDYIIVGGGATGCVLANRLSEDDGVKVLLLEAGEMDDDPRIHSLDGFLQLWGTDKDWQFSTVEQPGLNGRKVLINQGKVIGGGSSIHAMMYVRGSRYDYDNWNYLGNDGWSYEDVLPYFKKSEDYAGGASKYHGVGGLLRTEKCPHPTPVALAFMEAAIELGYHGGTDWDFHGSQYEHGAGLMQFNITKDGKRCSASTAFLTSVLARSNLTVKTKSEATRILFDEKQAVGVEYVHDGESHKVKAEKEVILSAGPFMSPKLLMLSGVGPAGDLKAKGISVIMDLPGVGQNLHDHVRLPVVYQAKEEMPVPEVLAETGIFLRTRDGMNAASPDLQLNFSSGVPAFVDGNKQTFIFVPILVQPQSRGYMKLESANPQDPPIINPNYLQSKSDVQTLVEAIKFIRKMTQTQAFSEFEGKEIFPGPDAELENFIRNNAETIWHPVGTCKMGRDALAVVDPQLRVYGIEKLRVADASVMPRVPGGNTFAACAMIGEKAADMIRSN